jgi:hypothetical protein
VCGTHYLHRRVGHRAAIFRTELLLLASLVPACPLSWLWLLSLFYLTTNIHSPFNPLCDSPPQAAAS